MKKGLVCLSAALLAAAILAALCSAESAGEAAVRLPIVMYHQISASAGPGNEFIISPETFERDMEYLYSHGYTSVTTQEVTSYCTNGDPLPEKPVLITFDDGYESFSEYALPVLDRYGMSAVLAIVGSYADTYTETEDHDIRYSYFSWDALAELQRSPCVEFAVHTHNMHNLAGRQGCKINGGESSASYSACLNADLEQVEDRFREYIGSVPCVFAYPYGLFCAEARDVLRERGYQLLFTCDGHVNKLTGDPEELMHLGRFNRRSGMDRERFFAQFES